MDVFEKSAGQPDEAAPSVLFLASKDGSYMTDRTPIRTAREQNAKPQSHKAIHASH